MTSTADRTHLFHALHQPGPLALPNAWDVASALVVEAAGAQAVATTSAGVAWSLGAADGDRLGREQAVALVARIAKAVRIPVTADIEAGFGETADEVAVTIREVSEAGASGVNLEDGHQGTVRDAGDQAERIAAARQAAADIYINARIDVYLRGIGDPTDRLDATVERATKYLEAGASGIFVPGLTDLRTVEELARSIPAPLNILAGPGAPSVKEMAEAGAKRISIGSAIAEAAYRLVKQSAQELLTSGTYETVRDGLGYGELNALFKN